MPYCIIHDQLLGQRSRIEDQLLGHTLTALLCRIVLCIIVCFKCRAVFLQVPRVVRFSKCRVVFFKCRVVFFKCRIVCFKCRVVRPPRLRRRPYQALHGALVVCFSLDGEGMAKVMLMDQNFSELRRARDQSL